MTIAEKIKSITVIDIYKMLNKCASDLAEDIIGLNQDQLYEQGIIDTERPAHRERYAKSTIYQKKRYAQYPKTEFVTLRWEGYYYDSMKLEIFPVESPYFFQIIASNEIWKKYLSKNPRFENAMGLTGKSIRIVRSKMKKLLMEKITDKFR